MRTIAISWDSLSLISYKKESRVELLVWVLLNAGLQAQQDYTKKNEIYYSMEALWDLVSCGNNVLDKRNCAAMVKALISLHDKGLIEMDNTNVKYTTKLKIKINYTKNKPFTCIRNDELARICTLKFADVCLGLCVFFRIVSHGGKHYYYQDLETLVETFSHEHYLDISNISSWIVGVNKKTLENIRHVIFFPNKDDIILTRYNGDNVEDSWITRKTLDSILDKLRDIKVLCEVKTQEGLFGNKIVFCKADHKELVIAYYNRVKNQNVYAKEENKQLIPKEKRTRERQRTRERHWG